MNSLTNFGKESPRLLTGQVSMMEIADRPDNQGCFTEQISMGGSYAIPHPSKPQAEASDNE